MPEPISEQILLRAVVTARTITRENNYPMSVEVKRYDQRGNATAVINKDMLLEVEGNAPEESPGIAWLGADGYTMNINFICTPKSAESSTTAMDTFLHRAFGCVRKAIGQDYNFNSLAINSRFGKPVEVMRGQIASVLIPLTVWFWTDPDDPFTQTQPT